jgi:hypothetical protein
MVLGWRPACNGVLCHFDAMCFPVPLLPVCQVCGPGRSGQAQPVPGLVEIDMAYGMAVIRKLVCPVIGGGLCLWGRDTRAGRRMDSSGPGLIPGGCQAVAQGDRPATWSGCRWVRGREGEVW